MEAGSVPHATGSGAEPLASPFGFEPDEDALIQNAIAKARIGRQERDVQILIVVLDREGCVPLTER